MGGKGKLDRRAFLKSAGFGASSFALGTAACKSKVSGRQGAADAGGPTDGGADSVPDAAVDSAPGNAVDSTPERLVEAGPERRALRPPNVLFVLADQWRAQATGYAGDVNARTPTLDRLAGESVTFAHAVSCTPVCCPYRASLMTGRYPTDTGVFVNDVNLAQDPCALAARFKQAGYDTGYIGKWHLDGQGCRLDFTPPERRQGFTRWAAMECTHDYNNSLYYAGDDGSTRLVWPGYDASAQTREMQRWLRERDPSVPFCYFLSWGPPHDPYGLLPPELAAQVTPAALELRPNVPVACAAQARTDLAGYYAHIAALDQCMSDLLGTLDELGLADDTVVVFTSDHGDMHGSQGFWRKQQPWDESILVPFLLRYPAGLGRSPRQIAAQLDTPDIMPTLLGLCGHPLTAACAGVRGRDLSPLLRQEQTSDDEPALIMCVWPFASWSHAVGGREYRGLRDARFTYARDLAGPWLLYDNLADPYQLTNLVDSPEHAATRARLDEQLAAKLAAIGDPFREGPWYLAQWGYTVNPSDGAVPYAC